MRTASFKVWNWYSDPNCMKYKKILSCTVARMINKLLNFTEYKTNIL